MDKNEIIKFKNRLKKLHSQLYTNKLFNSIFITEDFTIGYTEYCEECGCISIKSTNIKIPFKTIHDLDFQKIIFNYTDNFIEDDRLGINENLSCKCSNENYEFIDGKWIYLGDDYDFDF